MNTLPCSQRVFPFRLAAWLPGYYASYLQWLMYLLERLGRECTLAAWQEAQPGDDDDLLPLILSAGWQESAPAVDVAQVFMELLNEVFPAEIEGVSPEQARQLVEAMPPFPQIQQTFPNPNVWKEITAYQALHLRVDGWARLAEALIRRHGKQGELIVYDILRQERRRAGGGQTGSVAEFLADFAAQPTEANLFTAGLEVELVRVCDDEVALRIRQCEWARYFRERHPSVGYLIACSTDETAYRAFNATLRMQRTTTLMEGGETCDFRVYTVDKTP